jgi:hypothetical protein
LVAGLLLKLSWNVPVTNIICPTASGFTSSTVVVRSASGLFQGGYFLKDVCAAKRALARLFTSGKLIEGL